MCPWNPAGPEHWRQRGRTGDGLYSAFLTSLDQHRDRFDMSGVGEHVQYPGALQPVAKAVNQFADITGQSGGMARDVDHPSRPQRSQESTECALSWQSIHSKPRLSKS